MTEQRDIDLRAYDYAPGHYLCKCMHCGQHHEADKRALSCETCAMRRALVDFQARAEKAESALATAEAAGMERATQIAELEADRDRLDWLDSVNRSMNERNGTRYGWQFDINHNRAALTDHNMPALTVREAIDVGRGVRSPYSPAAAPVEEAMSFCVRCGRPADRELTWPFNGAVELYCADCHAEYERGADEIDEHETRVAAGDLPASACPRPIVRKLPAVGNAETEGLRAQLAQAYEFISSIANESMSQPVGLNMPDAQWYQKRAFDMIGRAARWLKDHRAALSSKEPTP